MIDFDKLNKGDWIEIKDFSGNTLSICYLIEKSSDEFKFHTFYLGYSVSITENSYFFLNDKWFRHELKDHNIISWAEVKYLYLKDMFDVLFKGRIKGESE